MTLFASLRNRIFLTSALLAVLSIGAATWVVSVRVTDELERQLQREVVATGGVVEQLRTTRGQTFATTARLIADAPKLKAAIDTDDPPTVQDTLASYSSMIDATLLVVTNRSGRVLATVGVSQDVLALIGSQPSIGEALRGRESFAVLPGPGGMLQLATVPVAIGLSRPDVLGTLSAGFLYDDALAAQLKRVTGSDIAFGMDGRVLASTLTPADRPALEALLGRASPSQPVALSNGEYVALPLPLSSPDASRPGATPVALILRSRTEQMALVRAIHTELYAAAVVAVLLGTLLSFAVARTITRPLAAITAVMRDVAATGDLTRKIVLRGSQRWDDEDARLLATTFNTLTDSIARFQREVAHRERLSSLGRLSTVIAHEVRNPLMIIKAALHALRRPDVSHEDVLEAVSDIDEEIARLNHIVNEVLDFARPIRFDLAPADLNAICAESVAAAAVGPGAPIDLACDPAMPTIRLDAARLRLALVNLIVNARQAMDDRPGGVVVSTRLATHGAVVTIADAGPGIGAADLPRVFDPFFTTKRGGTGLGLPIAKNIIEGLGGTLAATTAPGRGTEMRIELSFDAAPAKAS